MKKLLILFLTCLVQSTFSQNKEVKKTKDDLRSNLKNHKEEEVIEDENKIYNSVGLEIHPSFPGGMSKFHLFIDENYKKSNKRPTLQGKVYASFVIEKDGSLNDIKILRDIGSYSGDELLRVLKLSPKWSPGKQNGKNVRTLYSVVVPVQI